MADVQNIVTVTAEHVDEASFLWLQRRDAVHAPNYGPQQFADLDERLEAHVDGLRVAGEEGWRAAKDALDIGGPEDFFPTSVLAIESGDARLAQVVDRLSETPDAAPGVISALGWVAPRFLSGRVKGLLDSADPIRQLLGIAACAVHRKDPGAILDRFLESPAAAVRARALRTAGELGRVELMSAVLNALADTKQDARFWASRSAVLLGNRGTALDDLASRALRPGTRRLQSLQLAVHAIDVERCNDLLRELAGPDAERLRIIGAGWSGSIRYVPWLIEHMANPTLARVAGEAFVNITGADVNLDQLESMPPEDFEEGPTEDPADENVEVPEDVALPWLDVPRVKSWWDKNHSRFEASTRYFIGAPLSTGACAMVLENGFQRQRAAAALHLSLLNPGTPLFNTSAPAPRQQQLLARTG